jgi:uncharacterized membrane protein YccC
MRSAWVVQSVLGLTRLLLLVQGLFIATIAWTGLLDPGPGGPPRTPDVIEALIGSLIALGSFAIAWRMGRGRRWAAAFALAIEGLWAAVALVSAALPPGPSRWDYIFGFLVAMTAITGLLVRPVRLYLGWDGTAITKN